jgi:hypothetical protein
MWKWLLNMDDDEEEAARTFMAPWNRNAQVMFLPPPDEHHVRFWDWGFIDPLAYIKNPVYRIFHGDVDGAMEALASPFSEEILLKYLMDVQRNKKAEGGKVYNEYAPWGYQTEQIGGHLWKGLGPGAGLDMQRIVQAVLDDSKATWPELLALLGPRVVTLDLRKGMTSKGYDYMAAMSPVDGAREIGRDAARGKGPIEDAEEALATSRQRMIYATEKMVADVQAARELDIPDETIAASLAEARLPQWLITGLLDGATYDIVQHYADLDAGYAEEQEEEP